MKRAILAGFLGAALAACGDSPTGSLPMTTTTTTTAAPVGPTMAEITMTAKLIEVELSPDPDKFLRVRWQIELVESAGLDVKINFIRQDILNRDFDQFERTEYGFERVREICGSNVVRANSDWSCDIRFDINSSNFQGFMRLSVGMVDERDNKITKNFDVPLFAIP